MSLLHLACIYTCLHSVHWLNVEKLSEVRTLARSLSLITDGVIVYVEVGGVYRLLCVLLSVWWCLD